VCPSKQGFRLPISRDWRLAVARAWINIGLMALLSCEFLVGVLHDSTPRIALALMRTSLSDVPSLRSGRLEIWAGAAHFNANEDIRKYAPYGTAAPIG
jgi:hypothetical protein